MRNRALSAVVATALLLTSFAPAMAQTSAKDVGQKAAETGEAIKDYTVERKDEAVAHAKKLADDLDVKIKDLERDASKQAGEAKAKSEKMITDLKAKRAKASGKLDDLGKASKASWDQAKKGFIDAYRDLATAYNRAAGEFKK